MSPVEVRRILPAEATDFAGPVQTFLRDVQHGLYVDELGITTMCPLADPDDPKKVAVQEDRILLSGKLTTVGTSGYVVALDSMAAAQPAVIGLAKFARTGWHQVELEELDVALDRRGERIGPDMLQVALDELRIHDRDLITLQVLRQNTAAQKFYRGLGFVMTDETVHYKDAFPCRANYHYVMRIFGSGLRAGVAKRRGT